MSENKYNYKNLEENNQLVRTNKHNKFRMIVIVVLAMLLSFGLVGWGVYKFNEYSPKNQNKTETQLTQHQCCVQKTDTITSKKTCAAEYVPIKIIEEDYTNAPMVLMYLSMLVFISISLWGSFTALFKVLKSEHEMNSILFDIQKDIYKETQMWELTKQKKELENNTSKASEKDNSPKIDKEVQKRIDEFEKIEKVKLELKYKHELELKEKEIQALKEMAKQNLNTQPSEQEKIN
jgi:hypothetical protein